MFETFTAVLMVIVFLVPGFIWHVVEGQLGYIDRRQEWEKMAMGLLTRSTILYLPFSPLLYKAWTEQWYESYPLLMGLVLFAFILLLPALLGVLAGKATQKGWKVKFLKKFFNLEVFKHHHVPTAWDSVFNKVPPCWAIVNLKNGKQIQGFLGTNSHISSDPEDRDLYISHLLTADHSEFVKNTNGVYIKADEISSIELVHQDT